MTARLLLPILETSGRQTLKQGNIMKTIADTITSRLQAVVKCIDWVVGWQTVVYIFEDESTIEFSGDKIICVNPERIN